MAKWLVDGELHDTVAVSDRGLTYGDGLFETIAVRQGQCRFLDDHLRRLGAGCDRLQIPEPDRDTLESEIHSLAAGCERGALKLIITRGSGPRGYALPVAQQPRRILGIEPVPPRNRDDYRHGVRVRVCQTRISRNPALAGLKTLNRLEQVLARSEWSDPGIKEGVMLDDRGNAICGTMTNLFVVLGDALHTPLLTEAGVAGVMRHKIVEQAQTLDVDINFSCIPLDQLRQASELFLSNSMIGIWPVAALDHWNYDPGPITKMIMRALSSIGVEECAT